MANHKITKKQAGIYLRKVRNNHGYTQPQVADAIGLPHVNYLTYWERGQSDPRLSRKYFARLIQFYRIKHNDLRDFLGVENMIFAANDQTVNIDNPIARPPTGVLIPHYGTVQAAMVAPPKRGARSAAHPSRMVRCALPIAQKYALEKLFALTADGDSMTDPGARGDGIAPNQTLLCHVYPDGIELQDKHLVVAWIPSLGPDGMGVVKQARNFKGGLVLESLNPHGARYPAAQYPDMRIQGIVLGSWAEYV